MFKDSGNNTKHRQKPDKNSQLLLSMLEFNQIAIDYEIYFEALLFKPEATKKISF